MIFKWREALFFMIYSYNKIILTMFLIILINYAFIAISCKIHFINLIHLTIYLFKLTEIQSSRPSLTIKHVPIHVKIIHRPMLKNVQSFLLALLFTQPIQLAVIISHLNPLLALPYSQV